MSAGLYNLGDAAIATTVTGSVITDANDNAYITNLEGALAATFQVKFTYGSSGTSAKVYIQTSLDQGSTWIDVWCAAFTTSSGTKVVNLSGLTPKTTAVTPTDGSLADDTCVDGVFGDRFRAKITTVGTYAGSTSVSVRMMAR